MSKKQSQRLNSLFSANIYEALFPSQSGSKKNEGRAREKNDLHFAYIKLVRE